MTPIRRDFSSFPASSFLATAVLLCVGITNVVHTADSSEPDHAEHQPHPHNAEHEFKVQMTANDAAAFVDAVVKVGTGKFVGAISTSSDFLKHVLTLGKFGGQTAERLHTVLFNAMKINALHDHSLSKRRSIGLLLRFKPTTEKPDVDLEKLLQRMTLFTMALIHWLFTQRFAIDAVLARVGKRMNVDRYVSVFDDPLYRDDVRALARGCAWCRHELNAYLAMVDLRPIDDGRQQSAETLDKVWKTSVSPPLPMHPIELSLTDALLLLDDRGGRQHFRAIIDAKKEVKQQFYRLISELKESLITQLPMDFFIFSLLHDWPTIDEAFFYTMSSHVGHQAICQLKFLHLDEPTQFQRAIENRIGREKAARIEQRYKHVDLDYYLRQLKTHYQALSAHKFELRQKLLREWAVAHKNERHKTDAIGDDSLRRQNASDDDDPQRTLTMLLDDKHFAAILYRPELQQQRNDAGGGGFTLQAPIDLAHELDRLASWRMVSARGVLSRAASWVGEWWRKGEQPQQHQQLSAPNTDAMKNPPISEQQRSSAALLSKNENLHDKKQRNSANAATTKTDFDFINSCPIALPISGDKQGKEKQSSSSDPRPPNVPEKGWSFGHAIGQLQHFVPAMPKLLRRAQTTIPREDGDAKRAPKSDKHQGASLSDAKLKQQHSANNAPPKFGDEKTAANAPQPKNPQKMNSEGDQRSSFLAKKNAAGSTSARSAAELNNNSDDSFDENEGGLKLNRKNSKRLSNV